MRKNLFQISAELDRTLNELEQFCTDNQTDEVPEEINDRLVINQNELEDKLTAYYHVITELQGDLDTLSAYIKQAKDKKKAISNSIDRLKKYIAEAVTKFGDERKNGNRFYKLPICSVNTKPSNILEITNEELIPEEFKKVVTVTNIDKTAIKKAIKAGEEIKGAVIDDSKINVSFR